VPSTRPGARLPHHWLLPTKALGASAGTNCAQYSAVCVSTHDLLHDFGEAGSPAATGLPNASPPRFTLLIDEAAGLPWAKAAGRLEASLTSALDTALGPLGSAQHGASVGARRASSRLAAARALRIVAIATPETEAPRPAENAAKPSAVPSAIESAAAAAASSMSHGFVNEPSSMSHGFVNEPGSSMSHGFVNEPGSSMSHGFVNEPGSLAPASSHARVARVVRAAASGWASKRQVKPDGAILVRPDGHVAWRCVSLQQAVSEAVSEAEASEAAAEAEAEAAAALGDALAQALEPEPALM
jgi:hypothetical protein